MHVLLRLPDEVDDIALATAAAARGIGVRPLAPMSPVGGPERGLLLGYGRLAADRIDDGDEALASILLEAGAGR